MNTDPLQLRRQHLAVLPEAIQRLARNLAAHAYETDYEVIIAAHFNALRELSPFLMGVAARFVDWCRESLQIEPVSDEFADALTKPRA